MSSCADQGGSMSKPIKDGTHLRVQTQSESWRLTFYSDGRTDGDDAVCVDIERDAHNFAPTLTAKEAGALIDALLTLLPASREHSKLAGSAVDAALAADGPPRAHRVSSRCP